MSNEKLVELIVTLDKIGFKVLEISPIKYVADEYGNAYVTEKTTLVIAPLGDVSA